VKSSVEIAGMVAAGKLAREVLDCAGSSLRVGMTTEDIDGENSARHC
jgi:methionine aminopeptidase